MLARGVSVPVAVLVLSPHEPPHRSRSRPPPSTASPSRSPFAFARAGQMPQRLLVWLAVPRPLPSSPRSDENVELVRRRLASCAGGDRPHLTLASALRRPFFPWVRSAAPLAPCVIHRAVNFLALAIVLPRGLFSEFPRVGGARPGSLVQQDKGAAAAAGRAWRAAPSLIRARARTCATAWRCGGGAADGESERGRSGIQAVQPDPVGACC